MKKLKVILIAIIASIIYLIGYYNIIHIPLAVYILIIFWTFYLGTMFILDFNIGVLDLFTILLFPSFIMSALLTSLWVYVPKIFIILHLNYNLSTDILADLFSIGLIIFSSYAVIISMNIFSVSRYKKLPLIQAAQTIIYIYSYVTGYILFNLVLTFHFAWYFILLFYILLGTFLIFLNNWSAKLNFQENVIYMLTGLFLIIELSSVLLFIPISQYVLPLILIVFIYIYNGIVIHLNKRIFLKKAKIEYIVISFIILIIILITSNWGIAGNLIGK